MESSSIVVPFLKQLFSVDIEYTHTIMCIHIKNLPHVKRTINSVYFISLEQNLCSDSGGSRSECDLRQLPSSAANHSHRRWRWWVKHSYIFLLPNGHGILLKVWPFCPFLRHCSCVALQHLPAGKHTQLWHGAGVVYMWPARLQQCGYRLWWRQHHHQGSYICSFLTDFLFK